VANKKVLIVEDEPGNRDIIRTIVEEFVGLRTILAGDGEEALARVAESKPDLILLDIMMPRLDGIQVINRLKQQEDTRDIPIMAITALTRPKDRDRALKAGAVDYVDKPFDLDLLASKVRRFV
jgi:CheY-like chemotaxis protein